MGEENNGEKSTIALSDIVLPPQSITTNQRKFLRGLGHALNPLVLIGKGGISESLVTQLKQYLAQHELVKVKLLQNAPMDKHEAASTLEKVSGAVLVHKVGKTFLLYAPHPDEPAIVLPKPRKPRKVTSGA